MHIDEYIDEYLSNRINVEVKNMYCGLAPQWRVQGLLKYCIEKRGGRKHLQHLGTPLVQCICENA